MFVQTITMTGWLRKVGTSRLTNQRRWVVLEHSTLYYYADRAETQLKGVLHLPGCRCYFSKSVTDLHAHVFTVTTKPLAKSSALAASGRSSTGSMLPEELEGLLMRGAAAAPMGPQCVPLPPADLAVESSNLVASSGNGGGGSLEAEVLNPLHTSKIKYRWAASSEDERNAWVSAIRAAAGRPAIEQVALAWARVLKGALSGPAYKRMLSRMASMGARLPPHALSQPITVTACAAIRHGVFGADGPLTPPSVGQSTGLGVDAFAISPDMPMQPSVAAVQGTLPSAAVAVGASADSTALAAASQSTTPAGANAGAATADTRSTPPATGAAGGDTMEDSSPTADAERPHGPPPSEDSPPPDGPVARRRSTSSKRALASLATQESPAPAVPLSPPSVQQGGAALRLNPPLAAYSPAGPPPSLSVRQLPPLFASPPALHLSADWIRVVMRSSERLRDMDMEGGAQHMPPPPPQAAAPSQTEDKPSSGGGFLSMFRRSKNKSKDTDTAAAAAAASSAAASPVPALPASKLISASNPAALAAGVVPPSLMSPLGSSAGMGGGMSTPQRPTGGGSGGGQFSSGSAPSHRLRGPDSAAAAASSAAAMQGGPVRFRLSGGGQAGGGSGSRLPSGGPGPSPLRTPSGAGAATEDAVAAVAVAEAQRARRFAGHIAGDRVDTAQLQRDFGRDTVITAVQVHPVYTALAATHGVSLDPPEGGLKRHVNAAPHEVLSHVTASILEVVGGVNAALAAQYANPVRVPWHPSGGYGGVVGSDFSGPAALDASFEAAIGAYASDDASSAGGASPAKRGGLFHFPPSPARPSATRNTSNGAVSDGSGRPPLHPLADSGSSGTGGGATPIEVSGSDGTPTMLSPGGAMIMEHSGDRVPVFAMPPLEPRFHLGAWPYPPSSLSSSSDRGTWGGSGLQARALTFAREILLCSARTITGGDTFDAAAFLFQHPELALLMPDSASAPPIRLVVQVLPGVQGGGAFPEAPPPASSGPTHSRGASNDTDGSALSHFTDSLSSSGVGPGFGSSFSEAEGGSTDAVPPPILRVQLQSAMHYRLRSSELEDEELMGWDGGDMGPPLTPLGYAPATAANADDLRMDAEVLRRRWAEGDWARVTAVFTRDFVWGRKPQPAQIALAVQTHPGLGGGQGGRRLGSHHRRT